MKLKLSVVSLFLLIILILFSAKVEAEKSVLEPEQVRIINSETLDSRAYILKNYFAKYNSPLQDNAQDFVNAADLYEVDWRLVAAISGVESTFGKFTPGGFNCWGWGVYGDQALGFESYKDGIYTVTKGLREGYLDKGLYDPYAMNRIYASSPHWGGKVSYFLADIDKYSKTLTNRVDTIIELKESLEQSQAKSSAKLSLAKTDLALLQ